MIPISPPRLFREKLPLSPSIKAWIEEGRKEISHHLLAPSPKILLLVGPCSIHSPEEALAYGEKICILSKKLKNFFPVMRLFLEKPRTRFGWKGLLYDPKLDGSHEIEKGLFLSRKLLLDLAAQGVLAAGELLEPLAARYLEDLFAWGIIGARTSASQPHRHLASYLPFPIGFKNGLHGELDPALHGICAAKSPQFFLTIHENGVFSGVQTQGNPAPHLILRGKETSANYDPISVAYALEKMDREGIETKIVIDCSHGNSQKQPERQKTAFMSVVEQIAEGNDRIGGLMLESYLYPGKQPLCKGTLRYGISVTDPCLGWDETEELILWGEEKLSSRSTVMGGVQK